jgi:hypothetical protein
MSESVLIGNSSFDACNTVTFSLFGDNEIPRNLEGLTDGYIAQSVMEVNDFGYYAVESSGVCFGVKEFSYCSN